MINAVNQNSTKIMQSTNDSSAPKNLSEGQALQWNLCGYFLWLFVALLSERSIYLTKSKGNQASRIFTREIKKLVNLVS